jgi:hypothetical protein
MNKNIGSVDKIVRLSIAAILILLFAFKVVNGAWGYVILAVAALLILTSLISICPLYPLIGITTRKAKKL